MDDSLTWIPVTEVRRVKNIKNDSMGLELQAYTNWTAYKSATDGEVIFAVNYADNNQTVLDEAQVEKLVEVTGLKDDTFTMDLVCEMGNRKDESRITPFLPDKYVFLWAEKHSKPIRGEMPKTFQEYLSIVTRVGKPSVAQSVYSPGTNQQFTSAAAIVADPTPLPAPETAPSPPRPAARKRAPKKPVEEKAKPAKKRKQPAIVEEAPEPEKKVKKSPVKTEPAPKRQKAGKVKSPTTKVVAMIGEKIAAKLQTLGEAKLAPLRIKIDHTTITSVARKADVELNKVEVMFALAYLAHMITSGYNVEIHHRFGYVNLMNELDRKIASKFKKAIKKGEFISFGQFVIEALCFKGSSTAKTLLVYHSSVVEAIQKLLDCAESEREALITEMFKEISGDGIAAKLTLYYDSLLGPAREPEPDLGDLEYH